MAFAFVLTYFVSVVVVIIVYMYIEGFNFGACFYAVSLSVLCNRLPKALLFEKKINILRKL